MLPGVRVQLLPSIGVDGALSLRSFTIHEFELAGVHRPLTIAVHSSTNPSHGGIKPQNIKSFPTAQGMHYNYLEPHNKY